MFISASDLAQNDCSNTVWRRGNSSGQNEAFDQAIFLFVFYIMASCKYVNSDLNLFVPRGTCTLFCKPITEDNIIISPLLHCEKYVHVHIWLSESTLDHIREVKKNNFI